ncbi:MAG: DUF485 domain-containing protein [Deltaproteobacteria bacterium]|nr:DUF485 domain-containing protein [Deltaproteobacteria bacterium]
MEHKHPGPKIDQALFHRLVVAKWKVSLTLAAIMMVVYYGFILVLAFDKELLSTKIGEHMTVGIPVGLFLIILAWLITGVYVFWANSSYDRAVQDVLKSMRRR